MAGTITHAYFARDVYDSLNKDIKSKLDNSYNNMMTYGQGHDIFYFYFAPSFKSKLIRKCGQTFHKTNTKEFFINMINYAKLNNLQNDSNVLSYIYGYICHYALDLTIHPYVTYKGGIFKNNNKDTYKYNSKHSDIETYIDCYMISKREQILPNKFKVYKFCFNNTKPNNNLKNIINNTFFKTYRIKNISKYYFRSIKIMRFLYWLMRYDPYKLKNKIYKTIDSFTSSKTKKMYPISYAYNLNNNPYYLNTIRKKWCHPRYNKEIYYDSFFDLYNKALYEALKLIDATNMVLFNNKNINYLDKYFLNLSFLSGKDCDDKTKNKYFEY